MFRKVVGRLPLRLFSQTVESADAKLVASIEANYKTMHEIYDRRPQDLDTYRKMLVFRSKNLGMKELDLLIGTWAQRNLKTLERNELIRYEEEIIQMETPDLHKILSSAPIDFAAENLPKDHYLTKIRTFGETPHWNAENFSN